MKKILVTSFILMISSTALSETPGKTATEIIIEKIDEYNNKDRSKESENWTETYDKVQKEGSGGGLMR